MIYSIKTIDFKLGFLSNMLIVVTFENIVVEFLNGCSIAAYSYMSIHSVSKMYRFA